MQAKKIASKPRVILSEAKDLFSKVYETFEKILRHFVPQDDKTETILRQPLLEKLSYREPHDLHKLESKVSVLLYALHSIINPSGHTFQTDHKPVSLIFYNRHNGFFIQHKDFGRRHIITLV